MNQGKLTRFQIVNFILASGEYRTRLVNGIYTFYLGRLATSDELAGWLKAIAPRS